MQSETRNLKKNRIPELGSRLVTVLGQAPANLISRLPEVDKTTEPPGSPLPQGARVREH
jgi:hypothetical protein